MKACGFLKKWNGSWGIIVCPGQKRYFAHRSNIVSGEPANGVRCQFNIGPGRNAAELESALEIEIIPEGVTLENGVAQ